MGKTISVIGIGRVGLPLSLAFAEAGFMVYGIDVDLDHIDKLRHKEMPFIEIGAEELLEKHAGSMFIPTSDFSFVKDSDYVIITLGTPVDDHMNPDYSQIESILPALKKNIREGQLIVLRSTVAPGTTELIRKKLECDFDFFLAFCPERIAEGKSLEEIREVPQIIGGIDAKSSEMAKELFSHITNKCLVSDARSAELAKIFTNMYRYINFAIGNEFAIIAMEHGRSIYDILRLVNQDYKRGGLSSPGLTAGPCLYKDGFFLLDSVPFDELITASWRINENFPLYLIGRIKDKIDLKGKNVAILGMAFKKNIDDTRNSLSFKLKKAFLKEQCEVRMHDPHVNEFKGDISDVLDNADVVVIAVNHDEYSVFDRDTLKEMTGKNCVICDVWDVMGEGRVVW
ncbi:nucleotide sugar dehydrogenase [Candidatus Woesearchaeota archaeon]|nr:nucleotide sugar dehydrogenase [Candidatus Woesearchaeota archaeon]